MHRKILGTVLAAAMILSASACVLEFDNAGSMASGVLKEYKETVYMNDTYQKEKPMELNLDMKLAKALIDSTDDKLADVKFSYNSEILKPEFKVKDDGISLKNRLEGYSFGKAVNQWDVKITDKLPLEVLMRADASDIKLNMSSMLISSVNIDSNASKLVIDLTGDYERDGEVRIEANASAVRLKQPENDGIQIMIDNYEISSVSINNNKILKQSEKEYLSNNYGNAERTLKIYADLKVTTLTIE